MGLSIRKSFRLPGGLRVNAGTSGVSASKRFGLLTVTSRGHVTLRILPGVVWRIR